MDVRSAPDGASVAVGDRRFAYRCAEFVAALALLVAMMPVLLIAMAAIRLESKGPVLFRQWRGGLGDRPFRIWKLRTMAVIEDGAAVRQAAQADPRVTRVGAILRRLSIDEVPQLLNVLRGEMALVGPRPHPVAMDRHFADLLPGYRQRLRVRPGMTGLAQVQGDRGPVETGTAMARRLEADLWYVANRSVRLDCRILGLTALMLWRDWRSGARWR
jgi:lipopolysaccharide/colanic/teichoic acid biosynthesis glycosyltransferase